MQNNATTDTLPNFDALPAFERGYFEAAFFTSDDDAPGGMDYRDTGNARDHFSRLHPVNYATQSAQVRDFFNANRDDIETTGDDYGAGCDLWHTRNGHGVGYWDRGHGEKLAERLTNAAHELGEVYCNIDAEGVYVE